MGMEDIDEDEDDARRSKPEEVTVQLATSFLQRPLYLCLLQYSDEFTEALGWSMEHPYLALLEAKRAFKHVHVNNATGETKPIVSNETLAQCLGEAVITWKANRRVFLTAAANTILRFIHFLFGSHYAIDGSAQEALIRDSGKDTFVHMESSKGLDLQSSEGRRIALCHVLALLRWHDAEHQLYAKVVDDPIASDGSDFSIE
ncbi:hypothetical protein F5B21DRAFT_506478 [Xylaria acuta]|nr:hypothetical protein F5B21DRAFT_506478 [Xylaria acuta]